MKKKKKKKNLKIKDKINKIIDKNKNKCTVQYHANYDISILILVQETPDSRMTFSSSLTWDISTVNL